MMKLVQIAQCIALSLCAVVHSFAPPASRTFRNLVDISNRATIASTGSANVKPTEGDLNRLSSNLQRELSLDTNNSSHVDTAIDALLASSTMTQTDADLVDKGAEGTRTPTDLWVARGLYEIMYVKTLKEGQNPVGGKWTQRNGLAQRLFQTRRSFQHILGINETGRGRRTVTTKSGKELQVIGEVVNIVSLAALWGLIRANIILRGDVVGLSAAERKDPQFSQVLSKNAIRALLDPPRIVFGKRGKILNLNLGPRTSVVLDVPYVDDQIRVCVGGRFGTRFVFQRCSPADEEANEFRELLFRKGLGRLPIMAIFGCISYAAAIQRTRISTILAGVSLLFGILLGISSGGIESSDRSVDDVEQFYSQ